MTLKLWRSLRIPVLATTLALFASLPLMADLVKGTVKMVQGDVKLILPDGQTGPLTTTSLIPAGSRILTGDDGTAAITWMDGAHGVICPKTTVEVNSLSLTAEDGKLLRRVSLNLTDGTMYCELVHADGTGRFTVKTPKGTIEDKGTIWKLVVHGLSSVQVSVLEGIIDFFLPTGIDVAVHPGEVIIVGDTSSDVPHPDTLSDSDLSGLRTFWDSFFPSTPLPNTGNDSDYSSGNPSASTTGGGGGGGGNIPIAESPGTFVTPTPTPAPTPTLMATPPPVTGP